ncbi:MAG: aldehyde dehydrogenase family protein [Gammaproteobacteria bacterium]|nr:aldehyde dehydrogenase family protein [Gammaproteobacteria bacterium]
MKIYNKLYINGQWVEPRGTEVIDVINPATNQVIGQVPLANASDVDLAVTAAANAFKSWSQLSSTERARYITAIANTLNDYSEEMVNTITAEMGAPLDFCREVQVLDPIEALHSHATHAQLINETQTIGNSQVSKEPIGVCAFINPWNYPLHQMIGKVAPALAAGCTMVVKPSEIAPLHAFLLAQVIDQVGLPAGVFNLVNGYGDEVGEAMCSHPDVDMVSFTGSTRAGIRIAQAAAPTIKRVCQELGGKSPFIICPDADLATAVTLGVEDVMFNSGQTCTALTRMLVHQEQYQEAIELAKKAAESFVVGDPLHPDSMMGPMVSLNQRQQVRDYIEVGLAEGARLITGGVELPAELREGAYVMPTIFADVNNQMQIAREEIFGPVLCLIPYQNEQHAIDIANDTPYGLSARVWATDKDVALKIARQIKAGQVYINDGQWNNQAPFGGYKQSGNGRELGSFGVEEFFETKSIIS